MTPTNSADAELRKRSRDYSRSFNYSLQAEDHYLAGALAERKAMIEWCEANKKRIDNCIDVSDLRQKFPVPHD